MDNEWQLAAGLVGALIVVPPGHDYGFGGSGKQIAESNDVRSSYNIFVFERANTTATLERNSSKARH